ncbi:hypothetical protein [Arthrobacter glacialis]|uniref:hypothetical protein n=1 Tax=Arthrobacter glacialis TaxID=1664 RepID=UPI000CD3D205|nr:hypothetical protein [Arthrobacter glacialis]POH60521.1 hypothetical protein CVS28_02200 [Arthrobacter glacialis]
MTTAQHLGAPPVAGRGPARVLPSGRRRLEGNTRTGTELSSLYTSLALLGIAALASAAASSLLPGMGGETISGEAASTEAGRGLLATAPWQWAAGIASAVYGLGALTYGFVSFRSGTMRRADTLRLVVSIAALFHLTGLLLGVWRMPEASRTFDITLASLLALELSVIAVLGWRRNAALRQEPRTRKEPTAAAVVGTLFAASVLVAALTTVGMAASTAGELAVPHSGHSDTPDSPSVPSNIEQLKNQDHHH